MYCNSGIYIIRNIINGKNYIGSTVNLERRKKEHFRELRTGNHDNSHLQMAYNRYGEDNLIFSILEYVDNTKLLVDIEERLINIYRANDKNYGYNIREHASSNLGFRHSLETRERISDSVKGCKNPNFGKHPSKETKTKMSLSHSGEKNPNFGRCFSDEHKLNISLSHIGKFTGKNNPNYHNRGKNSPIFGKKNREGTSKYVGVYLSKNTKKKYAASIRFCGKTIHLGTFLTEEEAAIAYNRKARELHNIDYDINSVTDNSKMM